MKAGYSYMAARGGGEAGAGPTRRGERSLSDYADVGEGRKSA